MFQALRPCPSSTQLPFQRPACRPPRGAARLRDHFLDVACCVLPALAWLFLYWAFQLTMPPCTAALHRPSWFRPLDGWQQHETALLRAVGQSRHHAKPVVQTAAKAAGWRGPPCHAEQGATEPAAHRAVEG
eukprot:14851740-Alexandrium_andersonii.AAC.1